MTMENVLLFLWFSGWILGIYPMSKLMLNAVAGKKADSTDVGFSIFLSVCVCLFWPLVLLGVGGYKLSKKIWDTLIGEEESDRDHAGSK